MPLKRRAPGFTVIELLVATVLMGLLAIAIAIAYRAAINAQRDALTRMPVAVAESAMTTLLKEKVSSASCVLRPRPGGADDAAAAENILVGLVGQDCAGGASISNPEYFVFRLAADGRLLFARGPLADLGAAPAPELEWDTLPKGWTELTPEGVRAEAPSTGAFIFDRRDLPENALRAEITFSMAPRSVGPESWPGTRFTWSQRLTFLAPLASR